MLYMSFLDNHEETNEMGASKPIPCRITATVSLCPCLLRLALTRWFISVNILLDRDLMGR